MSVLGDYLYQRGYEPVAPLAFYRDIFPSGELDDLEAYTPGKYTAIALEIPMHGTARVKRYTVTDDLDTIDLLQYSTEFCVIAPISYAGKCRDSANARYMYALCVELDNLVVRRGEQTGCAALLQQFDDWIPRPTYLVASGSGLHLYYVFDSAIPLYRNVVDSLTAYKRQLTRMVWNRHTTRDCDEGQIQYESIFQGFRMVGTQTKNGKDKVEAYRTGDRVTIEYLNAFVEKLDKRVAKESKIVITYKSHLTRAEAARKYPEWYARRIVQGKPRGTYTVSRRVYDWWRARVANEAVVGHRYYCLMCLAIYAIKCGVDEDTLFGDMRQLLPILDARTVAQENHLTERDLLDAMQAYYDRGLITYPVNSIANRSGLHIAKNKRNGRRRSDHLELARLSKQIRVRNGDRDAIGGRPTKADEVIDYIIANPAARKIDVARALDISRTTVNKYWDRAKTRI